MAVEENIVLVCRRRPPPPPSTLGNNTTPKKHRKTLLSFVFYILLTLLRVHERTLVLFAELLVVAGVPGYARDMLELYSFGNNPFMPSKLLRTQYLWVLSIAHTKFADESSSSYLELGMSKTSTCIMPVAV